MVEMSAVAAVAVAEMVVEMVGMEMEIPALAAGEVAVAAREGMDITVGPAG